MIGDIIWYENKNKKNKIKGSCKCFIFVGVQKKIITQLKIRSKQNLGENIYSCTVFRLKHWWKSWAVCERVSIDVMCYPQDDWWYFF